MAPKCIFTTPPGTDSSSSPSSNFESSSSSWNPNKTKSCLSDGSGGYADSSRLPPTVTTESLSQLSNSFLGDSEEVGSAAKYDYVARHSDLIDSLLDESRRKTKENDSTSTDHFGLDVERPKCFQREWSTISEPVKKGTTIDDFHLRSLSSLSSLSSSTLSFSPSPASFLSPNCRLQKDKGAGIKPGTAVQVHGREAALEKLRIKTEILKKAAGGSSSYSEDDQTRSSSKWGSGGATIKRGSVKLTSMDPPETRSFLTLKMGFITMRYGILLQWRREDGLVYLIVMRKNPINSFMEGGSCTTMPMKKTDAKIYPLATTPQGSIDSQTETCSSKNGSLPNPQQQLPTFPRQSSYMIREIMDDSNAIIECLTGEGCTEVTLIQQPYLIPRPLKFPRSSLCVTVLQVLSVRDDKTKRPKHIYVELSVRNKKHRTGLINTSRKAPRKACKNNSCILPLDNKNDDQLKIEIYHRRHLKKDRMLSSVNFPLELIEPHHGNNARVCGCNTPAERRHPAPTSVTIPCKMIHDPEGHSGSIRLSLIHRSSYRWWLNNEIIARRHLNDQEAIPDTDQLDLVDQSDVKGLDYADAESEREIAEEDCVNETSLGSKAAFMSFFC